MSQTLEEVVTGDQAGFELRFCYYLQIKHGLMGFFPAIITETEKIVLVLDSDLIAPIWGSLDPKRSEVVKGLFYVNKQTGAAFSMSGEAWKELFSFESWQILSRSEFERITANGARPFCWVAGILGAWMSGDEFDILRARELEKLAA